MATVIVSWSFADQPPGAVPAHHIRVGLALDEKDVPPDASEAQFENVPEGNIAGHMTPIGADGAELATPIEFHVQVGEPVVRYPINPVGRVV